MAQLRQQHPLFQFTPLREGRHVRRVKPGGHPYFNSRPSARGDFRQIRQEVRASISIHAPPRGATFASMHGRLQKRLFQFTPLREGRPLPVIFRRAYEYFNSRPSARGDSQLDVIGDIASDFNSRPSARGDGWPHQKARCCTSFQFTPLREGRRKNHARAGRRNIHFNSRPSARGDSIFWKPRRTLRAFQFTPLREGRLTPEEIKQLNAISIHAPPRGATPIPRP